MCDKCEFQVYAGAPVRERKPGPTQTVYLPGDREPTMLANAIYRDARLNWEERRAKWLAWDCAIDRYARAKYGREWICTFKSPCRHCRLINN